MPLAAVAAAEVRSGLDRVIESNFSLLPSGIRTGVISNPTGVASFGSRFAMRHCVDILHFESDVDVVAVFGPEHGFRGAAPPGHGGKSFYVDDRTGLPVYAAYSMNNSVMAQTFCKLSIEMLLFDIQDVGVRFYTFIWTLYNAMLSATHCSSLRRLVVLDRPNPVGGTQVGGPVLIEPGLASLVGLKPIALQHGMTVGEISQLFAHEFLPSDPRAAHDHSVRYAVIGLSGWDGRTPADELSRAQWIAPSPNIPTPDAALVYVGFGLFEGTNLSIGRGTTRPFEYIGAPWVDNRLVDALRSQSRCVVFREAYFEPQSDVFARQVCGGLQVMPLIANASEGCLFDPLTSALDVLIELRRLYPGHFGWRTTSGGSRYWIDMLTGSNITRLSIDSGLSASQIIAKWHGVGGLDAFLKVRARYLMYGQSRTRSDIGHRKGSRVV